jgi:hypothetical protein
MKRRFILIALSLLVCLTVATAAIYSKESFIFQQKPKQQAQANSPLPRHVRYWFLCLHVQALRKQADLLEVKNENGYPYRHHYKLVANLTDEQDAIFNAIVDDTLRDVGQLDAEAKAITDEFHAKVPGGILKPGQNPPPLPPQLRTMQQQKDRMLEAGYLRLQESFGEKEFARFEKYLRENLEPHVRALTPDKFKRSERQPKSRTYSEINK